MLAQTTDSASSNATMANELSSMFLEAEQSVEWDVYANQIKCYTHKVGLLVNTGLKSLGLRAGHVKPTTSPGITLPTPIMTLNKGDEDLHFDSSENEQQDDPDHNQEPVDDNLSDWDSDNVEADSVCEVARAVCKVSISHSQLLPLF